MDLETVTRRLAASVAAHDDRDPDALATALTAFAEPEVLDELLDSVLADGEWLERVLARSYPHPNGFVKIVLISESNFQLRMHLWRPGDRSGDTVENIHSHHWDFASTLFFGGYRYQEFAVVADGEPFHAYTYHGHRAGSYALRPIGRRTLRRMFDGSLAKGTTYTLNQDVFHRVTCDPDRLTGSLVLQGPRRADDEVYIFAEREIETGPSIPLRSLSRSSFVDCVRDVRSVLA